jgi:hypothetical protein
MATQIALILVAGGAAACATGRASLGDIRVTASPPEQSTQIIKDFGFHVEAGRISMTEPGNPTNFDFSEGADGCLRGTANNTQDLRMICPVASDQADPRGVARWKSTDSTLTFTAYLSADKKNPDQDRIVVQSGVSRGTFLLGQGAAADELRKRPELIGAAFAYGYVPRANLSEGSQSGTRDYTFVVSPEA